MLYANIGFDLLGMALERAAGAFSDLMTSRVLNPLDLADRG